MNVAFHCEAGERVGGGHAVRCFALAQAFAATGARCTFHADADAASWIRAVVGNEFGIVDAPKEDGPRCDWLVADGYGFDADWETAARAIADRILAIDDLPVRVHNCDVLLDPTFGREASAYAGLVPPAAHVFAGTDYAPLREMFARAREKLVPRVRQVRHALVAPGYSDFAGLAARCVPVLARLGFDVDVVVGRDPEAVARVKATARTHENPSDLVGLLDRSDFAVAAAGSASWERCVLGLPSLVASVAPNQRDIAAALARAGAAIDLGSLDSGFESRLESALAGLTPKMLASMADCALTLCDGLGARRLVGELLGR